MERELRLNNVLGQRGGEMRDDQVMATCALSVLAIMQKYCHTVVFWLHVNINVQNLNKVISSCDCVFRQE